MMTLWCRCRPRSRWSAATAVFPCSWTGVSRGCLSDQAWSAPACGCRVYAQAYCAWVCCHPCVGWQRLTQHGPPSSSAKQEQGGCWVRPQPAMPESRQRSGSCDDLPWMVCAWLWGLAMIQTQCQRQAWPCERPPVVSCYTVWRSGETPSYAHPFMMGECGAQDAPWLPWPGGGSLHTPHPRHAWCGDTARR